MQRYVGHLRVGHRTHFLGGVMHHRPLRCGSSFGTLSHWVDLSPSRIHRRSGTGGGARTIRFQMYWVFVCLTKLVATQPSSEGGLARDSIAQATALDGCSGIFFTIYEDVRASMVMFGRQPYDPDTLSPMNDFLKNMHAYRSRSMVSSCMFLCTRYDHGQKNDGKHAYI